MLLQYNQSGDITSIVTGGYDKDNHNTPVIEVEEDVDVENKKVDPKTEELVWDYTLSEAKLEKIQEVKDYAYSVLSETDWYVIRKQEPGESIPQSVVDHRTKVRSLSDQFESDVNALESVTEVQDYSFEYPDPPEP